MIGIQIENKQSKKIAMKLLGTTNFLTTFFVFINWVLKPEKTVQIAKDLFKSSSKKDDLINNVYPSIIAVSYINEFYSKYLEFKMDKVRFLELNKKIDQETRTDNKIGNALIEIREIKKLLKINLAKLTGEKQDDQIVKTTKSFGVSPGVIKGTILNVTNTNQIIPKKCIGVFPTSGIKYELQFLKCVGIIFLNGAVTSHGSILAREYGIPAIVSPNIKIKNGTTVLIDGNNGNIQVVDTDN